MQVPVEGLAVFFVILRFFYVERNRWRNAKQVVVGPLLSNEFEERVPKEIWFVAVGGGALTETRRGWAVRGKCRLYDCTKGFPGEDVAP